MRDSDPDPDQEWLHLHGDEDPIQTYTNSPSWNVIYIILVWGDPGACVDVNAAYLSVQELLVVYNNY